MSRRSALQQRFAIALAPPAPQIWGELNSVPPNLGGLGGLLSR